MKEYKAGIYLRLSHEDKNKNNSIDAQRNIALRYARKQDFTVVKEYIDNGYSGVLDSRPALNKMMLDCVQKKINMVIVKDLSRLTRDKNKTGYYTEMFFPDNDVRFISVTEYIDSGKRYEIDDSIMLRGIINENYLADVSKKIKSVITNMKNEGKYVEPNVPYGYSKDKYKVVIDENVVGNVKLIYSMYLSGISLGKIAKHLTSMCIDTPKKYRGLKVKINEWRSDSVGRILKDPFYTGKMITNKTVSNYKDRRKKYIPKEEWTFIENHHEKVVSQQDFDKIQEMLKNSSINPKTVYEYPLKDLVYCGYCKSRMQYKVDAKKRKYKCRMIYIFPSICDKGHTIKEDLLNNIVFLELKKKLQKIKCDEGINKIKTDYKKTDSSYKMLEKYLNSKRKIENEMTILYNKRVEETVDKEEFKEEYNILKQNLKNLENNISILKEQCKDKLFDSKLKDIVLKFKICKDLKNEILKQLIKKIEVFEDNTINITFNF